MSGRLGVVLDRDATLIDVVRDVETGTVHTAFHPSQIRFLPGVIDGLKLLSAAGYGFAIASNQPGPAKGQITVAAVERTNRALVEQLGAEGIEISAVEVCLHHPLGGPGGDTQWVGECACRKPKPGLLLNAIARCNFDRAQTWMIGDSAADMDAARAANVRAALVFPLNHCEICPLRCGHAAQADLVASSFDELARAILRA